MARIIFYLLILMFTSVNVNAQKYFTRTGKISFFSDAPIEKIEAHNSKATSVFDTVSGRIEFAVLIKGFQFEKALMQEHFNENYMESDQFPKATFKGNITDLKAVDFTKDGEYEVTVSGDLEIHGVTKQIEAPGKIIINNGQISGKSSFEVEVADYNIEIPSIVRENIAKVIVVKIEVDYEKLKSGS